MLFLCYDWPRSGKSIVFRNSMLLKRHRYQVFLHSKLPNRHNNYVFLRFWRSGSSGQSSQEQIAFGRLFIPSFNCLSWIRERLFSDGHGARIFLAFILGQRKAHTFLRFVVLYGSFDVTTDSDAPKEMCFQAFVSDTLEALCGARAFQDVKWIRERLLLKPNGLRSLLAFILG